MKTHVTFYAELNPGTLRLSEEGWQALRRYFAKTERMPR